MPSPPKISFQDVEVVFPTRGKSTVALQGFTLDIRPEGFTCIVGQSGCGKTTALNLVAGFIKPSSGRVLIDGCEITGPGADRTVVFQADSVFPWMTVRQNVEYGPAVRGIDPGVRRRVADQLIAMVGLAGFENHFPRELSGGMKKRVDLARAYANDPEVLLMDEPFGALDVMTRDRMHLDLLRLYDEHRKCILFVTHDIEEALFLADRVVVMTARPARVRAILDAPFPRPRDPEIKTSPELQTLRRDTMALLGKSGEPELVEEGVP